jgi:beta-lactamase class A
MLRRSFLAALPLLAQAQQAAPTPLDRLRLAVERITQSVNATWGIYVKCLETGEEVALNATQQMDTMSTIKIPLMIEAFRQTEAGKFALSDRVKLHDEDKRPGTGIIRSLDAGADLSIKDLITLMIIVSDNTATDLMFAKVGGIDPVNRLMSEYGLTQTRATAPSSSWFASLRAAKSAADFHREGKHPYGLSSPRDMGVLLEKIKTGQAVSKGASDQMLQIMRGQVYSSRLPKYVSTFRIPHKTGDFLPYIGNDVGIFESPRRNIVVSVFTANHFGEGAVLEDAIARIGQQVADYFSYRD